MRIGGIIRFFVVCLACFSIFLYNAADIFSAQKTPLKEAEEKEIFIRCFSDIGYGDPWMQQQHMERAKRELQEILNTEEEDVKKRSKLAVSLGTMSGILLVLILL